MTTATILPTARTVFLDANANPLSYGQVYFYQPPNTTTLKTTWQDAGATIPNTNPVILDGNGSALIYGSGQYLQYVYDSNGNLIYSGLTQDLYALVGGAVLSSNNTWTGTNIFNGPTTFAGTTIAVTQPAGDTSSAIATDAFVNTTPLTLANGTTAVTQAYTDNSTKVATTAFVNGTALIRTVKIQKFTSSGTYTPSAGLVYAYVVCTGGGGGGYFDNVNGSGGGGAGGTAISSFTASSIGTSQTVTVGAQNGTSSLGGLIIASGGSNGNPGPYSGTGGAGGAPGAGVTGTLLLTGGWGGSATPATGGIGIGGFGGASFWGGGGLGPNAAGTPAAGSAPGSGGGGAAAGGISPSGGPGASGIVVITEYCSQ